ncbi:unnamed protein product [Calypogeia fissa]
MTKMHLLKFVVGFTVVPLLVNVVSSDIYPPLKKHTSLLTRLLIFIGLFALNYIFFEAYHVKSKIKRPPETLVDGSDGGPMKLPHLKNTPKYNPLATDPESLAHPKVLEMMDAFYAHEKWGVKTREMIALTGYIGELVQEEYAQDLEAQLQSDRSLAGSRVFYRKFEIGPETTRSELDSLCVQMTQFMRRAREIDEDCTLQFGSFALLKYQCRNKVWMIRGFNLQNAKLKASTKHESGTFDVLQSLKAESGEDVLFCKEPSLLRHSAPRFWKDLYIYASSLVEIEEGVLVRLQSQPISTRTTYWISVIPGLVLASIIFLPSIVIYFQVPKTHTGMVVKSVWHTVVILTTIFYGASWWIGDIRHRRVQQSGSDVPIRSPSTHTLKNPVENGFLEETTGTSTEQLHGNSKKSFVDCEDDGDSIRIASPLVVESNTIEKKEHMVELGCHESPIYDSMKNGSFGYKSTSSQTTRSTRLENVDFSYQKTSPSLEAVTNTFNLTSMHIEDELLYSKPFHEAMAERTADSEESDADSDSVMEEYDAALTALEISENNRTLLEKRPSVKDSKLSIQKDCTVGGAFHPARSSSTRCSAVGRKPIDLSKLGERAPKKQKTENEVGEANESLSGLPLPRRKKRKLRSTLVRSVRAKRARGSPQELSLGLAESDGGHYSTDDVNVDNVPYPVPYCSCTGVRRECCRWGNGGWQSSCCTSMISRYPLPMNPTKTDSRLAGRKISAGAFEKLLEKLGSEGIDVNHPVDLNDHWAKHGTNRYVTLRS